MGQDGRKPEQHRRRFRDIFKRSDNISHRNDHSQKKSGQSNQSKPTEEPEQQGQPQTPLAPPTAKEGNIPATPAPTIIDELWGRAFQQLAPELQKKLRARGMDEKRTVAMKDQLGAFKAETERLQEASKGRDWKLSVKGQEIPVRDLTVRIVGWAIKLGNVAMPFAEATCPAAAVWGVVTLFLQGIQNFDTEKKALLSVAEKVTQAMFLGQLYSGIYTLDDTENAEVVKHLYQAIVDLYACVLKLLVISSDLASNTVTQFCHSVFKDEKPAGLILDLANLKNDVEQAAVHCEVTAKALHREELSALFKDTQLLQMQSFEIISEYERKEIRNWVSMVPFGDHHEHIEDRRDKDLGDWLIKHDKFVDWMQSDSVHMLWLQGSPGVGKTFLISNVVAYFKSRMISEVDGFAYFFCNRDESDRRKSLPVLQSLILQLAATSSFDKSIRASLRELWVKKKEQNGHLGLVDCQNQLSESFAVYPTTFVILDALDEVESEERRLLLDGIRKAMSNTPQNTVKLLVAGRPDVLDKSWPTITIQAQDNSQDIEHYVDKEVNSFIQECDMSVAKREKDYIIKTLLEKSDNMFLWANLQINRIRYECNSFQSIETVLESLPVGLDEAYKKIYEEIQRLPGPDRELAECALKWVYASPQLLTTEEIMSALRVVQKKDGSLSTIGGIEERSLKRMCKNLLIVDSDDHWRFFHLSAREYLDSKVGFRITSQEAHLFCAEICTRSLLLSFDPQDTKFPNPGPTKGANPDRLESPFHPANPFSRHCQVYWPFYARTEVVGAPHLPFLERFLGSPTEAHSFYLRWLNFALSFRPNAYYEDSTIVLADHARNITQRDYRLELLPKTPIFLIAYFALGETLREWCDKSDITPFSVTGDQNYLLTIAAQSGCVSLCTTLIARGRASAEGDFQLCLSQALFGAVNEGNKPMVEYLIKEGADVNLIPEDKGIALDYSSPIDPAARSGNVDLVKYLVECAGANVRDALGWATESPSEQAGLDITKYLIQDRNTDPNLALYRHFSGSPLVAAAVLCQKRIVRYYLDNTDAHVNVLCQDGSYGSALDAMVGKESLEELKYFIEKGKANVNLLHECGENGSALSSAVSRGDLKIVKYLVEEAGADVNLQLKAGKHGSAMAAAIAWDRREIIYYIADYAQINLPFLCGKHGSALAAAFHPRNPGSDINMDLVRFFIEAGADVNLEHQTGDYGSPFVAAVFWARGIGIIEYLVDECGANIHACYSTGIHGSALTAAAAHDGGSNTLSILEYLVDLGVQVNVPLHVGVYGSALVAAAARGHLSSVKYLVEKGKASVDYRPMAGSFGSALAAAAANCKCEIMEYLLGKGDSNVNLRLEAGSFGSALTAAIVGPFDFSIPYDVVQPKSYTNIDLQIQLRDDDILLASRAVFASSALWERVLYAVEYLIDAGADVNLMLQAGAYGNALAAATAVGHFDQVQLLVSKGKADVKAQLTTGSFGSALVVAILADSTLRKLSLDYILAIVEMSSFRFYNIHDLSTYIPSDDGALSMIKSTIDSMRGIMAYLLESGADVDQQLIVGPYGSALVAAAAVGSLRHVRFLVEKWNADVNLQLKNGSYANAYEAAITNGHDDIAEYLMQKGSNSEIIGSEPLD